MKSSQQIHRMQWFSLLMATVACSVTTPPVTPSAVPTPSASTVSSTATGDAVASGTDSVYSTSQPSPTPIPILLNREPDSLAPRVFDVSPDGRQIVFSSDMTGLESYSLTTGNLAWQWAGPTAAVSEDSGVMTALRYSPNGIQVGIGYQGGRVYFLDGTNGGLLHQTAAGLKVQDLVFTGDSSFVAAATENANGTPFVRYWEMDTYEESTLPFFACALSTNAQGSAIIAFDGPAYSGVLVEYDFRDGHTEPLVHDLVPPCSLDRNDQYLGGVFDNLVRVWRIGEGGMHEVKLDWMLWPASTYPRAIDLGPEGRLLVRFADGNIAVMDLIANSTLFQTQEPVWAAQFDSVGQLYIATPNGIEVVPL